MNISTTPIMTRPQAPQRLVSPSLGGPPAPTESFQWSQGLALPAYTYGAASAALSGLCDYAQRFPAGGITINPNGIVLNPDWTRHFAPESVAGSLQPILAGVSATLFLVRCGFELREAVQTGSSQAQTAAALDLTLAITSAMQLVNPSIGAAATLAVGVARGLVEASR